MRDGRPEKWGSGPGRGSTSVENGRLAWEPEMAGNGGPRQRVPWNSFLKEPLERVNRIGGDKSGVTRLSI